MTVSLYSNNFYSLILADSIVIYLSFVIIYDSRLKIEDSLICNANIYMYRDTWYNYMNIYIHMTKQNIDMEDGGIASIYMYSEDELHKTYVMMTIWHLIRDKFMQWKLCTIPLEINCIKGEKTVFFSMWMILLYITFFVVVWWRKNVLLFIQSMIFIRASVFLIIETINS